jgi:hypothetical protein
VTLGCGDWLRDITCGTSRFWVFFSSPPPTEAQAQSTAAAGIFATLPVVSTNWSTGKRVDQAHRREFFGPPPPYCRGRGV